MPYATRDYRPADAREATIEGTSVPEGQLALPRSLKGLHAAAFHGHADGLERAARALADALEGRDPERALRDAQQLVEQLRSYALTAREEADYTLAVRGSLLSSVHRIDRYDSPSIAPMQHVVIR
jgi:O6-methylguanine-DNA--protein-cysteine methyltransferase